MRLRDILVLAVFAGMSALLVPGPSAQAFTDRPDNHDHVRQHSGWDHMARLHCRRYPEGCRHGDPYGYSYVYRGYYPYYNSGYWGPPRIKRFRGHVPPYYASWGATRRGYHHVKWHRRHHGGHRRGDW